MAMKVNYDNIALVTTTFYKEETELRCQLAFDMAKTAQEAGYTLVVVDDSPNPSIREKLKAFGAKVFPQLHRGMGPPRREVYFHATEVLKSLGSSEKRIIIWLEPEKGNLIRFIPDIVKPILNREVDVVVPQRTERSWESYPSFQHKSESQGNQSVATLSGRDDLDVFFGPVASTTDAANLVIKSDPKSQEIEDKYVPQYLAAMALQKGLTVGSVKVDFIYSPEQKNEEETTQHAAMIEKRKEQLARVVHAHQVILAKGFVREDSIKMA